ncbi:MAG: hypothetical protein JSR66_33480 [Proteobacteria bacterium]|nr:hypothetical protein [Pseudomonadota bacterium]
MQTSRVISDNGLKTTARGYRIDVRLPWYRSLPVSTVEVGEVAIDGQVIDPSQVTFELEGRAYALADMAEQVDKVWFVLDSAYLNVETAAPRGGEHEVSVTLNLYPPYIRGLKRVSRDRKNLQAR